jgi:TfoX/Sxy family transcriptional regulator of competence genes
VKAKAKPFSFESARKGLVVTSYWQCPDAVMKDGRKLRQWIGQGPRCRAPQEGCKAEAHTRKPKNFPF